MAEYPKLLEYRRQPTISSPQKLVTRSCLFLGDCRPIYCFACQFFLRSQQEALDRIEGPVRPHARDRRRASQSSTLTAATGSPKWLAQQMSSITGTSFANWRFGTREWIEKPSSVGPCAPSAKTGPMRRPLPCPTVRGSSQVSVCPHRRRMSKGHNSISVAGVSLWSSQQSD
jgi:hypothetical protein